MGRIVGIHIMDSGMSLEKKRSRPGKRENAERRVYLRTKHSVMEHPARHSVLSNDHVKSSAEKIGNIGDMENKVSVRKMKEIRKINIIG